MSEGGYLALPSRPDAPVHGIPSVPRSMSSRNAPPQYRPHETQEDPGGDSPVLREIVRQLRGLRFGSIEIIVHEGHVTQIERREKVRVNASSPQGGDRA